jgi:hypothetical protein
VKHNTDTEDELNNMNINVCSISAQLISVTVFFKTITGGGGIFKKTPLEKPRNIKVSKMLDLREIGSGTEGGFTDSCEVKLSRARHDRIWGRGGIVPLIPKRVTRWEVRSASLPGYFTHRTH